MPTTIIVWPGLAPGFGYQRPGVRPALLGLGMWRHQPGGVPAGPAPGADPSLPLIPFRYCCRLLVLQRVVRARSPARRPLPAVRSVRCYSCFCVWLPCPACYSPARARQLASLSVAACGSAATVRPSARGQSARFAPHFSYAKLAAPALPSATTHHLAPAHPVRVGTPVSQNFYEERVLSVKE